MAFKCRAILIFWKPLCAIGLAIALLPLILNWDGCCADDKTSKNKNATRSMKKAPYAAYTMILVALYWVTECLPLAVTSLVPIFLLPYFGILTSDSVASAYLGTTIIFLLGGCVLALSFEYSNLHTRIALNIILLIGARIPQLLFGIMFTTMFLSMFMNNTSCTAMMLPLVNVIMDEFKKTDTASNYSMPNLIGTPQSEPQSPAEGTSVPPSEETAISTSTTIEVASSNVVQGETQQPEIPLQREEYTPEQLRNLKIMFLLATSYAANIGGTGIITGTGTNLIAKEAADGEYLTYTKDPDLKFLDADKCQANLDITFVNWFTFNVFPMLICVISCWAFVQLYFVGLPRWLMFRRPTAKEIAKFETERAAARSIRRAIEKKHKEMGPMTFHEISIIIIFILMVCMWIFRQPRFTKTFKGWGDILQEEIFTKVSDSSSTILICLLLFSIPKDIKYYKEFFSGGLGRGMSDPLLKWSFLQSKLPWGVFFMLGGGISLSRGAKQSGLNDVIERTLRENEMLQKAGKELILVLSLLFVCILTMVASNTATASIISPVLLALARTKAIHPFYLLMPATTAASYAFVLPVSTPPNAIVFDQSGCNMKQSDMAKPGIIVTILCAILLYASTVSICELIFGFSSYDMSCTISA